MNSRLIYSCVLDYSPLMAVQTYIWLINLLDLGIDPKKIYIHCIGQIPKDFLEFLHSSGVKTIFKDPFDHRNRYCNKLVQLDTFIDVDDFDYVFLMDCDTAIVDLKGLVIKDDAYAKIVDFANPPIQTLQKMYSKNGFSISKVNTSFSNNNGELTDWNNCNGGVYILSKDFLTTLSKPWKHYALWCIDHSSMFGENFSKHADQVGFGLAMASLDKKVIHLGMEWNYPTHIKNPFNINPKIVHFHAALDSHMKLKLTGLSNVDNAIEMINNRIDVALSKLLKNSMFWDFRYQTNPKLGSGVGSRGDVLEYKKRLVGYVTYGFNDKTIIDVGCGDLELMKDFKFKNYLGLDVSNEAIKIGKSKREDWCFATNSIVDEEIKSSDLVMSFDVLIHQSNINEYQELVKNMVVKAKERVIIGAYNSEPEFSSTITHFHSGILNEIESYNKFDELSKVGQYRDVTVVVGSMNSCKHKRDIGSTVLNRAFLEVKRPDLLRFLVDVSRHHLGFYTAHYPRVFEYTWLLEQLENQSGLRVLDIGSGVCPVPLCLSHCGMKVTTIDSHPTTRLQQDKAKWNEWGFLNYSVLDKNIKSKHINFTNYRSLRKYDCIYSISVIEHMPKSTREKVLKRASRLLKTGGGYLLLTVDLIPHTDNIWNFSEGKQVEEVEIHGHIRSFKDELVTNGFIVVEEYVQRNIPDSRTDLWFVKATLKK